MHWIELVLCCLGLGILVWGSGLSSRFPGGLSRTWDLRLNLEVVHSEVDSGDGSMDADHNDTRTALHNLRFVLFTFLVLLHASELGICGTRLEFASS